MDEYVLEGNWEDLIQREDLRGHRVRVIVLDDDKAPLSSPPTDPEEWSKRFNEWLATHSPVGHFVDDSRESIYEGTIDNPR
jgi:hypothetical protein